MAENAKQEEYAKSLGAIGKYKSPNGRTYAVFPDMETGMGATQSDLQTKLSGGSSWVTPNTTLGQFASGWTSGPRAAFNKNAAANYARITGFSQDTKISQIPVDLLTKAIVLNEGVDPSVSANIQGAIPDFAQQFISAFASEPKVEQASAGKSYSPSQEAVIKKYMDTPTQDARRELIRAGLSTKDVDTYSTGKKTGVAKITPAMLPSYRGYVEDGKLPADATLKAMGITAEDFVASADTAYGEYLKRKASDINSQSPTMSVEFIPEQYSSATATQREKLNESINKISDFDNRMTQLIELFEKRGTEL